MSECLSLITNIAFDASCDRFNPEYLTQLQDIISEQEFSDLISSLNNISRRNKNLRIFLIFEVLLLYIILFCLFLGWVFPATFVMKLNHIAAVFIGLGIIFVFDIIAESTILIVHNKLQNKIIAELELLIENCELSKKNVFLELEKIPWHCEILWINRYTKAIRLRIANLRVMNGGSNEKDFTGNPNSAGYVKLGEISS